MSLVSGEKSNFQFIIRLLNTNIDGKQKVSSPSIGHRWPLPPLMQFH